MAKNFNHPKVVERYDEHIRQLIPAYDFMHMQIRAIMKTQNIESPRILIAGCGTGYEIEYLLELFPQVEITALDPAESMIDYAQSRIEGHPYQKNVKFVIGDTSFIQTQQQHYDFALAVLVSHFLKLDDKRNFFQHIAKVLKPSGLCLSVDMIQPDDPTQLEQLRLITIEQGLSEAQSQTMLDRLQDDFHLIAADDMHSLLQKSGFRQIHVFTQLSQFYGFSAQF